MAKAAAGLSALLIVMSFAFPLWSMKMVAPQYPDGLDFHVYAYKFAGGTRPEVNDIEEINTLNHYIGMAELREQDFPELKILPFGFALTILLLGWAAFKRSRMALLFGLGVLAAAGVWGLSSAYHRLYQYGHALSPDAPMHMAPFTPMMLGTNQLANFVTTGYFHVGGYLLMVAGFLAIAGFLLRPSKI